MEIPDQGVKGLVLSQGNVLILYKPTGELDLPGGRVEPSESLEKALKREIFEESGLKIKVLAFVGDWPFINGSGREVTINTYLCKVTGGKFRLSDEHISSIWLGLAELLDAYDQTDGLEPKYLKTAA